MLISSDRHTTEDLRLWSEMESADRIHGAGLAAKIVQAGDVIREFARKGNCYAGVSWGKDSVVLAHLLAIYAPSVPLAWVKQIPLFNPDCELVRDAFLRTYPSRYEEIVIQLRRGHLTWHATGSIEAGFARAVELFGPRYFSGIRAGESGGRKIRMRRHGPTSKNACAPLGWWTETDIFGYLAIHDLPVHPVYAMLGQGRWDRERIRTCRLDGRSGDGIGRAEWESEYYGDVLRRIAKSTMIDV